MFGECFERPLFLKNFLINDALCYNVIKFLKLNNMKCTFLNLLPVRGLLLIFEQISSMILFYDDCPRVSDTLLPLTKHDPILWNFLMTVNIIVLFHKIRERKVKTLTKN